MAQAKTEIVQQRTPGEEIVGSGGTLTKVDTGYTTAIAVQKPRDIKEVMNSCLKEAELLGDSCYYNWNVAEKKGGREKRIEGGTIDCAMVMARNWQNLAIDQAPIIETPNAWIYTVNIIDLQTGVTFTRTFRQPKAWAVYGRYDAHRKEIMRFEIGQSKAVRNAILAFLPNYLKDAMINRAKEGTRKKLEKRIHNSSLATVRIEITEAFESEGIELERIQAKYGAQATWNIEQLVQLSGDLKAIMVQSELPEVIFPRLDDDTEEQPEAGAMDKMQPGDTANHQSVAKDETGSAPPIKSTTDASTSAQNNDAPDDSSSKKDGKQASENVTNEERASMIQELDKLCIAAENNPTALKYIENTVAKLTDLTDSDLQERLFTVKGMLVVNGGVESESSKSTRKKTTKNTSSKKSSEQQKIL